ncbi:MAG TPA: EVE domain-containing protein [Chloroflexota bacterium]|nr:EVE domain-containing protein [Chloroflexota bacterium]
MAVNHWLIVTSPENIATTRDLGYTMQGIKSRHRKKAERMQPGDRMVLYATGRQAFAFTATITSPYWEDHTMVWDGRKKGEDYPFRVKIQPDVVLPEADYVPAVTLLPALEFPRKWPAEHWHLAFQGNVHLIPEADFARIEAALRAAEPAAAAP